MAYEADLDAKLLKLAPDTYFTARDAVQHVAGFGQTGSGKSSGPGRALAEAYLRAGMGGLVLTAKPSDAEDWQRYCAATGRNESLIVWRGSNFRFNFIAYELSRLGAAGLNSVVECLLRILEMARLASAAPAKPGDAFWEDTTRQILRNTIPVLFAATGTVRIADILNFVRSAPTAPDQMADPEWQRQSHFCSVYLDAAERLDDATGAQTVAYWRQDFARLDPKTRGNMLISLTTALDRFNHGWLRDTFCTDTNVVPELCFQGAVIVMDMPILVMQEDAILAQMLFKFMFQRSVLSRNQLPVEQRRRFVFCWMDEAQLFVNSADAEFMSTCRSSRACVVMLSQSLASYFSKIGGDNARDRTHYLLAQATTKIFCANSCTETNEMAARTLGRVVHRRGSYNAGEGSNHSYGMGIGEGTNWGSNSGGGGSSSYGQGGSQRGSSWNHGSSYGTSENSNRNRGSGTNESTSWGYSEQMDYLMEPSAFGQVLKTGGRSNGGKVTAVWYQASRRFPISGSNAFIATFQQ